MVVRLRTAIVRRIAVFCSGNGVNDEDFVRRVNGFSLVELHVLRWSAYANGCYGWTGRIRAKPFIEMMILGKKGDGEASSTLLSYE